MPDQEENQREPGPCPQGGEHHRNPPEIVNGQVVIRCGKCGNVVG